MPTTPFTESCSSSQSGQSSHPVLQFWFCGSLLSRQSRERSPSVSQPLARATSYERSGGTLGCLVPQHGSNSRTIPDSELRQQAFDVVTSGEVADPQFLRDFSVRETVRDEACDFDLARA